MFDYRLKVFLKVAQRLSFTKAAKDLFISQPAVSKHIKAIEKYYECALFERNGNRLKLTPQGEILKKYAKQILSLQQEMDSEIKFHNSKHHGHINIGASTTASQYVLPQILSRFKTLYPNIKLNLITGNTEKIEQLLLDNHIDIGIVEGKSKRATISYSPFKKDEIVLCTNTKTPINAVLKINELKNLSFVIRESGSGTLEIIQAALNKNNLKIKDLDILMVLENNESIKTYLKHAEAFAFMSLSAILEELKYNQFKIVDVENLSMERYYYVIQRKETQNSILKLLKNIIFDNQ